MKKVLLVTVITGVFAVGAPLVIAQTAKPAADAPAAQQSAPRQHAHRLPSERVEARLAYLHTALKINASQQTQWDSFANVLRAQARSMDKRFEGRRAQGAQRPDRANVTAIERLERTQQRTAERAARLGEVVTAAKPLYAALSPEQKQIADQMLAKSDRGRFHHRRGGSHRGA